MNYLAYVTMNEKKAQAVAEAIRDEIANAFEMKPGDMTVTVTSPESSPKLFHVEVDVKENHFHHPEQIRPMIRMLVRGFDKGYSFREA